MGKYLVDDNFIAQFKQVWRWFRANILSGDGRLPQSVNRPAVQYDSLRVVKLTSAADEGGRYNAKSCVGSIDVASDDWTGGKSLPAGMKVSDDEDVLAIYPAENGTGQNDLEVDTDTSFYLGKFVGATDDGKRIVVLAGGGGSSNPIDAKITGYTPVSGATNKWAYSWTEQQYLGQNTWQDLSGGRSSTTDGLAYNSVEANNSDSGIQGNGVNLANIPAGKALQPIQGFPVVKLYPKRPCDPDSSSGASSSGTSSGAQEIEWVFEGWNAIDGDCTTAS